jgi:hypothetical protein
LEAHYKQGDWKLGHAPFVEDWNKLFEEERMALRTRGRVISPPFPDLVAKIMASYVWYYRDEQFKPFLIEQILEVPTPLVVNGKRFVFKGRLDIVLEDEEGLYWLVDNKTAATIPQPTAFHSMDPQLMWYPWATEAQYNIKIAGVIYNYVRSKAPGVPKINKDGSLSKRKFTSDYPTLFRFLKKAGYDPNDYAHVLKPMQTRSEFLRRYKLPRSAFVTKEILMDGLSVVKRIEETKRFTRTITRDCVRCSYVELCKAELYGLDSTYIRSHNFVISEEDYVVSSINSVDEADEDE